MEIQIGDYVETVKVNPYAGHITALEEAGPGKAATVIVPAKDALKTRTAFSKAANDKGYTARVRVNAEPVLTDKGKPTGNVKFVFTLTTKHKARRGNKA
jgi:hypothetical protein